MSGRATLRLLAARCIARTLGNKLLPLDCDGLPVELKALILRTAKTLNLMSPNVVYSVIGPTSRHCNLSGVVSLASATPKYIEALKRAKYLVTLGVPGVPLDDLAFKTLASFALLQQLDLTRVPLPHRLPSVAQVAQMAQQPNLEMPAIDIIFRTLTNLKSLGLAGGVYGPEILELTQLQNLQHLSLAYSNIRDNQLAFIAKSCTSIVSWNISGCPSLTYASVDAILGYSKSIKCLMADSINKTSVEEPMPMVTDCTATEILILSAKELNRINRLVSLAQTAASSLRTLHLESSLLTDDHVRAVARSCTNLEYLVVTPGDDLKNMDLNLPRLEFLVLNDCKLESLVLNAPNLTHIWFNQCRAYSTFEFRCPNVRHVKIVGASGKFLREFGTLPQSFEQLEVLHVYECDMRDTDVLLPQLLPKTTRLKFLYLGLMDGVSDESLAAIGSNCASTLEIAILSGDEGSLITNEGLLKLKACKRLRVLDVCYSYHVDITAAAEELFRAGLRFYALGIEPSDGLPSVYGFPMFAHRQIGDVMAPIPRCVNQPRRFFEVAN